VDEERAAGGSLDERADRGAAVGADDEVAFPVSCNGSVVDLG
jgi:hypothetical protein